MGEWGWQMEGWTPNYQRVKAFAPSPRWNEIDPVEILHNETDALKGEIRGTG
jgi:hypothetical protein